jgi:phosphoenolpyruvate carboxykinase (GTP)
VLRWIIDRCTGTVGAHDTAIGYMPTPTDLDQQGLQISAEHLNELLAVDPKLWQEEFAGIDKYLAEFGERVPAALRSELRGALERVHSSQA